MPEHLPLEGLRVVELASGLAGPLAGMLLADYGAEVVKVEGPEGDWARGLRGFQMWNRGKHSVVLDLEGPDAGHATARELLRRADVVITDYNPAHSERLRLSPAHLSQLSPRLIRCAIGGFGALPGYEHLTPHEGIVAAAAGKFTGMDVLSGASPHYAGDRPLYSAAPVASYAAGQLAFQGIAAALLERERTGLGRAVETSLLHGLITATMRQEFKRDASGAATSVPASERQAIQLRGIALTFLTARCADGTWIQMCARQDHHFRGWLRAMGIEDLLSEPRFAGAPMSLATMADVEDLERILRDAMSRKTADEWMELFIDHDVGADPFLTFDEFLAHPQMTVNGRVVTVNDPVLGPVRQLAPLIALDEQVIEPKRGAPALGQHACHVGSDPAPADQAPAVEPSPDGPLSGITIIELATFLAGPLGSTLLAEMGARVIKVEPVDGDPFRRVGLQFTHLQHGKESVAVNIKSPAGQEIVRRLIARADVVFHNFRAGPVRRMGCDWDSVRAVNPRIVYVNAASYGSRGPEASRTAFHSTPNALSGGGILQAGRGNPPVDDSYPDPCSGITVASAILLGLLARQRDGHGHYLETTMLASTGLVHSDNLVSYAGAPARLTVDPGQNGLHALYRLYECAAGWLFLAAPRQEEWRRLGPALGHPEWPADSRFADEAARLARDDELSGAIGVALKTETADEWAEALTAAGVAAVRADAAGFEEFLISNGVLTPDEDPEHGPYWRVPTRVTFDGVPGRTGASTRLGESTVPVLAELGFTREEIERMEQAHDIASPAHRDRDQ
jgi:crotonobetainyl-CoA:carnitine CoA-transferase CaiB-like acyl-CoA transferase